MTDFIDRAEAAATGPPSSKSKPTTSDSSRAKDVSGGRGRDLGSLKGSIRGPKRVVEYGKGKTAVGGSSRPASQKGFGGSSAGLKTAASATLKLPGGGYEKNSRRNVPKAKAKPAPATNNPIGRNSHKPVRTDLTRRGRSADSNSIGSLEKRMKLDKAVR